MFFRQPLTLRIFVPVDPSILPPFFLLDPNFFSLFLMHRPLFGRNSHPLTFYSTDNHLHHYKPLDLPLCVLNLFGTIRVPLETIFTVSNHSMENIHPQFFYRGEVKQSIGENKLKIELDILLSYSNENAATIPSNE